LPQAAAVVETVAVSQAAAPSEGPVKGDSYRVRPGDSLWSIARRQLGPQATNGQLARQVNRLWELNEERIGTGDPSMLHVGTVLTLP
jgi:nucleoid-associated protein YgaU